MKKKTNANFSMFTFYLLSMQHNAREEWFPNEDL